MVRLGLKYSLHNSVNRRMTMISMKTKFGVSNCTRLYSTKHEIILDKHINELDELGFTVIYDIFTSSDIEDMKKSYIEIQNKANYILNNTCAYERKWQENDQ